MEELEKVYLAKYAIYTENEKKILLNEKLL